uniref:Uncharacterized protein n=1 Tax=Rhizophora mucronata TaxID=61149 RepID=A0A2P2QF77_RHIMU
MKWWANMSAGAKLLFCFDSELYPVAKVSMREHISMDARVLECETSQ